MKKIAGIILCVVVVGVGAVFFGFSNRVKNPYTQEYVPGQGNIKGNVDTEYFENIDSRFEIGADKDGYAVFKNPKEAYKALTEKYADGIKLIQEEFELDSLRENAYEEYGTYGCQVNTGTTEEKEQADFVSSFFDIYENSFT